MTFVLDASVTIDVLSGHAEPHWSAILRDVERRGDQVVAPDLMWSEIFSVLHERRWRGGLDNDGARIALRALLDLPIEPRRPAGLRERAWQIADRMGWAKTYDAEYCALAELLGCEVITGDRRLRAAARGRLDYVLTAAEAVERLATD